MTEPTTDTRPRRFVTAIVAGAIGAAIGIAAAGITAPDQDPLPPPRQPLAAEVEAAVVVDSTTIEMRGFGPDGKPGKFLYDCERNDAEDLAPGDPTLICTQREEP